MAFVSGPRQCGKTTLARNLLKQRGAGGYFNWDEVSFRRNWAKNPASVLPSSRSATTPLLVLDELHKARGWKSALKGLYDTIEVPIDFLVTGSARLNVFKKGGDSLLGRSWHFRLHPFSLAELETEFVDNSPEMQRTALASRSFSPSRAAESTFAQLLRFGGFPEPFLQGSEKMARLWRRSRTERVIREDLRDLSRIPDLSRVEMLASLLPERVGSPLSRNALREELFVSYETVTRWLMSLSELYYAFMLKPYTRRIARSLQKEAKLYLWDWTEVENDGARFENLVACHLLKACDAWTDTGEGTFELCTLKNREHEEIDFLIVSNRRAWLPVEVKLSDTTPSRHWAKFLHYLDVPLALQLVAKPGVWNTHQFGASTLIVASAAEALRYFV